MELEELGLSATDLAKIKRIYEKMDKLADEGAKIIAKYIEE
ncbi:hypothetical protein [Apilactobacillus timberlakei]|nr:hypothetical protein [Apilactobacillus timberlakei]